MSSALRSRPSSPRSSWILAACGVGALAACGLTLEAGEVAEPGVESGTPPSTSSGSALPSSSSSSSSSGAVDADAPPADSGADAPTADVCTSFDLTTFVCPAGPAAYGCTGDTAPFPAPEADAGPPRGFRLNAGIGSQGGLWVRSPLKKSHAFTAVAVLIAAPDEGSSIDVGMGAAFALIAAADSTGEPSFPALGGVGKRLSLSQLGGGTGVAAYWRDYHDTAYNVGHFRIGTTSVPSEAADEVDGWDTSAPTTPTFDANDGAQVRITLTHQAGEERVKATFERGTSNDQFAGIGSLEMAMPDVVHFVGVTAAGGPSTARTRHRVRALRLDCPAP